MTFFRKLLSYFLILALVSTSHTPLEGKISKKYTAGTLLAAGSVGALVYYAQKLEEQYKKEKKQAVRHDIATRQTQVRVATIAATLVTLYCALHIRQKSPTSPQPSSPSGIQVVTVRTIEPQNAEHRKRMLPQSSPDVEDQNIPVPPVLPEAAPASERVTVIPKGKNQSPLPEGLPLLSDVVLSGEEEREFENQGFTPAQIQKLALHLKTLNAQRPLARAAFSKFLPFYAGEDAFRKVDQLWQKGQLTSLSPEEKEKLAKSLLTTPATIDKWDGQTAGEYMARFQSKAKLREACLAKLNQVCEKSGLKVQMDDYLPFGLEQALNTFTEAFTENYIQNAGKTQYENIFSRIGTPGLSEKEIQALRKAAAKTFARAAVHVIDEDDELLREERNGAPAKKVPSAFGLPIKKPAQKPTASSLHSHKLCKGEALRFFIKRGLSRTRAAALAQKLEAFYSTYEQCRPLHIALQRVINALGVINQLDNNVPGMRRTGQKLPDPFVKACGQRLNKPASFVQNWGTYDQRAEEVALRNELATLKTKITETLAGTVPQGFTIRLPEPSAMRENPNDIRPEIATFQKKLRTFESDKAPGSLNDEDELNAYLDALELEYDADTRLSEAGVVEIVDHSEAVPAPEVAEEADPDIIDEGPMLEVD